MSVEELVYVAAGILDGEILYRYNGGWEAVAAFFRGYWVKPPWFIGKRVPEEVGQELDRARKRDGALESYRLVGEVEAAMIMYSVGV